MTGRMWDCTRIDVRIPSDSVEFVPVVVTREGAEVRHGLDLSVTPRGESERDWRPIDMDPTGRTGILVDQLDQGTYQVAIRTASGAVLDAGRIRTT